MQINIFFFKLLHGILFYNCYRFEILVTLEGVVEPSGNTTQVRTSFIPQEILWGHSFMNCVSYANKEVGIVIQLRLLLFVLINMPVAVSLRDL